jgi:RNA polymerase sigma factor (sigma-70 family)
MKGLNREESKVLVEAVLANEPEAFKAFHDQFSKTIWKTAIKWSGSIFSVSGGLYATEDIVNELWLHIWKVLPKYDADKANLMTWICIIAENTAGMLYRNQKSSVRYAGDGKLLHYHDTMSDNDSEIEFVSLIMDPKEAFDNVVLSEAMMYDYLFLLSQTIASFSQVYKLVYIHLIKGLTQRDSSAIIGISQSYVARIRMKIVLKAKYVWEKTQTKPASIDKSHKFAINLMSNKSEEDLMEEFGYDLAVIKICRQFLDLADIARVKSTA